MIDPNDKTAFPSTEPTPDPFSPALELMITKSMLYAAAIKHGVNPYLVMGLAWHESGWNPSAVSSAGAVGIMQVMPATAAASGPALLNRKVNLFDPADNIDLGIAILRSNLDRWHSDLAKALVAYCGQRVERPDQRRAALRLGGLSRSDAFQGRKRPRLRFSLKR